MKRLLAICCTLALALTLAACGTPASSSQSTATPKDYAQIIQDSRVPEDNEAYPIIGIKAAGETPTVLYDAIGTPESDYASMAEMLLSITGVDAATTEQFAVSTTMMNVRVYGVGIFKPAEGQSQVVKDALNGFVTAQQKAFENYLPDQYEISKQAVLEEVPSGEIILVMCEGASDVATKIKEALK